MSTLSDAYSNKPVVINLGVIVISLVSFMTDIYLCLIAEIVLLEELLDRSNSDSILETTVALYIYLISNVVSALLVAMSYNEKITTNIGVWLIVTLSVIIGGIIFGYIHKLTRGSSVGINLICTFFASVAICGVLLKASNLENATSGVFTLVLLSVFGCTVEYFLQFKNVVPGD